MLRSPSLHCLSLGLLLFIVYLNDFESCLEFSIPNKYADDTCTTIASSHITELITMTKKDIINISDWLRVNKPNANPQATEFMAIGHQRRMNTINDLPSLKLNDNEINRVGKVKSLCVIVDEGLKWKNQFKSSTEKASRRHINLEKSSTNPNNAMFTVLSLRVTYATET